MHYESPSSTTNAAGSSISVSSNSTLHLQLRENLVEEAPSSRRSNPSKEMAIPLDLPDQRLQGETSILYHESKDGRDNTVVGSSLEKGSRSSSDVNSALTLSPNAEGEMHETNPNSESSSPSSGGTESEMEELIKSAALVPRMARPHYQELALERRSKTSISASLHSQSRAPSLIARPRSPSLHQDDPLPRVGCLRRFCFCF